MFTEFELVLHRRLVNELERNVESRDWWLWVHFHVDEEDVDPDVTGIGARVEAWLGTLGPLQAGAQAYRTHVDGAGIHVEVTAQPRGAAHRGEPTLVGNPLPYPAFFLAAGG